MNPTIIEEKLFESGNKLVLYFDGGEYATIGKVKHFTVSYLEDTGELNDKGKPTYYVCAPQHFALSDFVQATKCFVERSNSNDPHKAFDSYGKSLMEIKAINDDLFTVNVASAALTWVTKHVVGR